MMATRQRGSVYRVKGGYGIRWREPGGSWGKKGRPPFPTKTAARDWYERDVLPRLRGGTLEDAVGAPETLSELVSLFLTRHEAVRSPRTVQTLRERLRRPVTNYGTTSLRDLERMSGDLADFAAELPDGYRHAVMRSLRQVFGAAVRWGYMTSNPAALAGPNPVPPARSIRVYTLDELAALEAELGETYGPIVPFAAATGLRPAEWARTERRDVDRERRILTVRGTKTDASRREVPFSARALAALDRLPPRLDTMLLFAGAKGGVLDLDNFRSREWTPAVEASGIAKPARIYDLRSTFASNALAAGVAPFELARIMGTSIRMIERCYGTLIDGANDGIAARLDALDERLCHERATSEERR